MLSSSSYGMVTAAMSSSLSCGYLHKTNQYHSNKHSLVSACWKKKKDRDGGGKRENKIKTTPQGKNREKGSWKK